jgi:cysteine desulfurase family protein (TIGR01976 family)
MAAPRATPTSDTSTAAIRSQFPALARRENGLPVAYFDGPGGTQVPRAVAAAVEDYLFRHNANTHWLYPTSAETDAALDAARRTFADFVGGAPEEIAFGANMTTLTYHLGRALGRGWGPGDEVVVTELDHHANVDTWRALAAERGITVRTVRMRPETGTLDMDDLARSVTPKTKLVAIGFASNALGTVNDVVAAGALARRAGALLFVDAVHSAPHVFTDVAALGADFLACSAYKFYGPHVGVLWAKRLLLQELDPPRLEPASAEPPENVETGTLNHEGIVGAAAAVDFLAGLAPEDGLPRRAALARAFAALAERGDALFRRMWDGLGEIRGVTRYGLPPGAPRTPTLSFVVAGRDSSDVARALARRGLYASNGDFYAATAVARLGHARDGVVRAGCACYTTADEVDRLVAALAEIAAGR